MEIRKFALACLTIVLSSMFIGAGIAGPEAFKGLVDGVIVVPMIFVLAVITYGVMRRERTSDDSDDHAAVDTQSEVAASPEAKE